MKICKMLILIKTQTEATKICFIFLSTIWLIYTLPVNVEVKQNPTGNPKIAPAKRFRKTEPGMANVCLKR